MKLLLASKSTARRQMLESAGVPFEIGEARLDEETAKSQLPNGLSARDLAEKLAEHKALSAAGEGLLLGADQTLEQEDGTAIGKPSSPVEAFQQLRSLSGRTHWLHSAAALAENGSIVWRASETVALTMRPLSHRFIEDYLEAEYEHVRWSVGGYRIEGPGVQLFERIEGSHFAILGLPLLPLLSYLREREVLPS